MRYLQGTIGTVRAQANALWTRYEAQQRLARGLRAQDSLDRRRSVLLPLAQAVTNGTNGYVLPVISDDGTVAALPLDDWALAQDGQGGVNLAGHRDASQLDPKLQGSGARGAPAEAADRGRAR